MAECAKRKTDPPEILGSSSRSAVFDFDFLIWFIYENLFQKIPLASFNSMVKKKKSSMIKPVSLFILL